MALAVFLARFMAFWAVAATWSPNFLAVFLTRRTSPFAVAEARSARLPTFLTAFVAVFLATFSPFLTARPTFLATFFVARVADDFSARTFFETDFFDAMG